MGEHCRVHRRYKIQSLFNVRQHASVEFGREKQGTGGRRNNRAMAHTINAPLYPLDYEEVAHHQQRPDTWTAWANGIYGTTSTGKSGIVRTLFDYDKVQEKREEASKILAIAKRELSTDNYNQVRNVALRKRSVTSGRRLCIARCLDLFIKLHETKSKRNRARRLRWKKRKCIEFGLIEYVRKLVPLLNNKLLLFDFVENFVEEGKRNGFSLGCIRSLTDTVSYSHDRCYDDRIICLYLRDTYLLSNPLHILDQLSHGLKFDWDNRPHRGQLVQTIKDLTECADEKEWPILCAAIVESITSDRLVERKRAKKIISCYYQHEESYRNKQLISKLLEIAGPSEKQSIGGDFSVGRMIANEVAAYRIRRGETQKLLINSILDSTKLNKDLAKMIVDYLWEMHLPLRSDDNYPLPPLLEDQLPPLEDPFEFL